MEEFLKVIPFIAFSGTKFFFALPVVVIAGYSPIETILITCTGGLISFFIFFYFGKWLRKVFLEFFIKKERKKFSKKNRWLIKMKNSYGLWGLAIITPSIIGIPFGAIIAAAFFGRSKQTIAIFVFWILFWSITMSYGLNYFT